ncbi:Tn5252 ORF10 [Streptococcus suis]|nr:Tn5252 ORF10 [Streptococcus suis]
MTDHYRIIRKEINLTPEELEQIQELMKKGLLPLSVKS